MYFRILLVHCQCNFSVRLPRTEYDFSSSCLAVNEYDRRKKLFLFGQYPANLSCFYLSLAFIVLHFSFAKFYRLDRIDIH